MTYLETTNGPLRTSQPGRIPVSLETVHGKRPVKDRHAVRDPDSMTDYA